MPETALSLGWEEWVSLQDLNLPAIKAKIDTGAKTSALHAVAIEPFGTDSNPKVRFIMHPNPSDPTIEVVCSAKVTSPVTICERTWNIELTLTNRETMGYRMLLGRSALTDDMSIQPSQSFIQPELSFESYKKRKKKDAHRRPLRIAILMLYVH